jgi:hypothetical protein
MGELERSGWKVELLPHRRPLPIDVLRRYSWIPADYRELMDAIVDPDQRALRRLTLKGLGKRGKTPKQ